MSQHHFTEESLECVHFNSLCKVSNHLSVLECLFVTQCACDDDDDDDLLIQIISSQKDNE